MKVTKILVQGEADNSLEKGDSLYFVMEEDYDIGNKIKLSNNSETIQTTVIIIDKIRDLYHGMLLTEEPVQNRLDLTKVMEQGI